MYSIEFRPELNLLDIGWAGLFTPAAVSAYAREVAMQFGQHGFRAGYRLRMDMTDSGTQPQDALPIFAECFAAFPKASRIAIITPSALTCLQVRRIMTQSYMRIFARANDGLAWLLAQDESAAA